ncbi:MAG: 50S ribosomal protein L4 [Candidatus Portnoybacteria bacterium RIFCSPLOWO2_01_FULL_43_11]|uniref:Large ribosomal subunit protein uL4 n=4 Tax=Candidatus Portnoyibacteriota TaxID=1817913 RepID=A0A1G2FB74_9BACT|nr:MAG: 50S ribosomal protein L4 [Candidatus Portnoybacteria bacterium RIFCSPHIGHO2_01_FULL_40_12b]OGZ36203.1 MAG: 50S ribosomal protein L4 [Candidatus Portnoybacteria bacterium RIFCSPHIGHO2_02_FULL_40_23]OGZ38861.1 MAG: 50S ribosomal protein L4 [Candidatus Portnoybacteria bacterium RIFCSPLOWO2_01_FULL_43_11]OGZ39449.1 MAG: 50S ribosomal protein L4 [Candidatus Portnoybacteria bacterium RIFCSPHIGHO2_12_FULL_40_11]OGZ40525.1 MAG: 50S ribosomal protein L4 [Candidatus Portnoybacteria bacterium RIFC
MLVNIYNQQGKEIGKAELPSEIFDVKMNNDLVHQAVVTQMANKRQVLAHTKDRSEVRGGGKKPWRQKGTGRARHGSIRSPIWKGGGVTFGPTKERVFSKKINKKMKRKALFMALSSKVRDQEFVLLDKLELVEAKTKKMFEILRNIFRVLASVRNKDKESLPKGRTPGVLIVLPASNVKIIRAARNIPKIKIIRADSLNVVDILSFKYLLMPQEAVGVIEKTYLK